MDFYGDEIDSKNERQIIGYCGYDKSEIYEGDDYVEYRGKLYHRENFLQMNLGTDGKGINDEE